MASLELKVAWPWWLHPVFAVTLMTGSTALLAIALPASAYEVWSVPKYLDVGRSSWLMILMLIMVIGMAMVTGRVVRSGAKTFTFTARQIKFLHKTYTTLLVLTILGYVIWMASAVIQGVGFGDLTGVLSLQAGAIGDLKASSRPIGGLTTLTQFGPVVVVLGPILAYFGLTSWSRYMIVVALAAFRSVFYAERLALIEVLLPLLVVSSLIILGRAGGKYRNVVKIAPLLAGPGIWGLFAALEYTRTWVYYQHIVNQSFVEWVSLRLVGYYVTAFNNSAMFNASVPLGSDPYFTVRFFWNSPGIEGVVAPRTMSGLSPEDWWWELLNSAASPAFTNTGSFLVVSGELGPLFSIFYWLSFGLLVGLIYVGMRRGQLPALVTYCVFFTALLELPRFMYWTEGRSVPIFLACLLIMAFYPADGTQALRSDGIFRIKRSAGPFRL